MREVFFPVRCCSERFFTRCSHQNTALYVSVTTIMIFEDLSDVFAVSHIYGLYVCALLGPWLGSYIQLMHAFDMDTFCKARSGPVSPEV